MAALKAGVVTIVVALCQCPPALAERLALSCMVVGKSTWQRGATETETAIRETVTVTINESGIAVDGSADVQKSWLTRHPGTINESTSDRWALSETHQLREGMRVRSDISINRVTGQISVSRNGFKEHGPLTFSAFTTNYTGPCSKGTGRAF